MKLVLAMMLAAELSAGVQRHKSSESYSMFLKSDNRTWCGFANVIAFRAATDKAKPTDSARVTYSSGKLTELTYQIEADSGDWIVIDKYTPDINKLSLRRAVLYFQDNVSVVEDAIIIPGIKPEFHIVEVTTLDGKLTTVKPDLDYPDVEPKSSLSEFPFIELARLIRSRSAKMVCRMFN